MCKREELSIQNSILLTSYYHEMAYQRVISLFPVINFYSYIIVYSVHWSKNPSIDSLGKYDKIVSNAKLMIINKV